MTPEQSAGVMEGELSASAEWLRMDAATKVSGLLYLAMRMMTDETALPHTSAKERRVLAILLAENIAKHIGDLTRAAFARPVERN